MALYTKVVLIDRRICQSLPGKGHRSRRVEAIHAVVDWADDLVGRSQGNWHGRRKFSGGIMVQAIYAGIRRIGGLTSRTRRNRHRGRGSRSVSGGMMVKAIHAGIGLMVARDERVGGSDILIHRSLWNRDCRRKTAA